MKRLDPNGSIARLLVSAAACLLTACLFTGHAAVSGEPGVPKATAIEVSVDNARTRVAVDVSRAVSFNVYVLPDPYRAIIDLPEVEFSLPSEGKRETAGAVSGYRFGTLDRGRSRIVMDVSGPVLIERSYVSRARDGKPARLVVELFPTDPETFARVNASELGQSEALAKEGELAPASTGLLPPAPSELAQDSGERRSSIPLPRPKPDRTVAVAKPLALEAPEPDDGQRVVVIDPGHGGVDPGATGVRGSYEKDVVLAFSKVLAAELRKSGRYKVVLTRETDVFLTLADRVRVARTNNANLFIALHADSIRRSDRRGATVYTLSEKGSDAEAEALAQKENRADIIGGVNLGQESEEVTGILIDLAQRETKHHSTVFAKHLADGMKPVTRLASRPLRSAGFRVLKAPDVPSVLLELGYLSSRADEALLTNAAWRAKVAKSVAEAVDGYFSTRLAAR